MKKNLNFIIVFVLMTVFVFGASLVLAQGSNTDSNIQVSSTVSKMVTPVVKYTPPSSTKPASVLKTGQTNGETSMLQAFLYNQGFLKPPAKIDGMFGTATKNALIEFQKATGVLKPDGVFGKDTALYIDRVIFPGVFVKDLEKNNPKAFAYLKDRFKELKNTPTVAKVASTSVGVSSGATTSSSGGNQSVSVAKTSTTSFLPKTVLTRALSVAPLIPTSSSANKNTGAGTSSKVSSSVKSGKSNANVLKDGVFTVAASGVGSSAGEVALNTNYSSAQGSSKTNMKYICATVDNVQKCLAVKPDLANAVEEGKISAATVIAAASDPKSSDGKGGFCLTCYCANNDCTALGVTDAPWWVTNPELGGGCPFGGGGVIIVGGGGSCSGGSCTTTTTTGGPGSGGSVLGDGTPNVDTSEKCVPIGGRFMDGWMTADNTFKLYQGFMDPTSKKVSNLKLICEDVVDSGFNIPNSGGIPSWTTAEHCTAKIDPNNSLFAVVKHDNWVEQGALWQLHFSGMTDYIFSHDPRVKVMQSSKQGPTVPVPGEYSIAHLIDELNIAQWTKTNLYKENGMWPWGFISNIAQTAKWVTVAKQFSKEFTVFSLQGCPGSSSTGGVEGQCLDLNTATGSTVTYGISFTEPITVKVTNYSDVKLTITNDGYPPVTATFAGYIDNEPHKILKFTAIVSQNSDAYVGTGVITLSNGAKIVALSGNPIDLTITSPFSTSVKCTNTPPPPPTNVSDLCMNYRNDEYGNPTEGFVYYQVIYSEPVIISGDYSKIKLSIKHDASAPVVLADFVGFADSTHKILKFKVGMTDIQEEYYGGVATIKLESGVTIKNASGGNVELNVGTFNLTDECKAKQTKVVSGIANYRPGLKPGETGDDHLVDYMLTFDGVVNVTGSPTLKITNKNGLIKVTAKYTSGSGTKVLTFHASDKFNATTKNFNNDWNVDFEGTGTLVLDGGSIKDQNGIVVDISIPSTVVFDNPTTLTAP